MLRQAFATDLLLDHHQAVDETLGARRTTRDVYVHGNQVIHAHDHVAEHVDQPAVGVAGEALIVCCVGDAGDQIGETAARLPYTNAFATTD